MNDESAVSPVIVLINPQMGENIGAAMRVMANFGLNELRLVAPRDGWPNPRAQTMASGAYDLVGVEVFDSFAAAIADRDFVLASSARPRDMVKPVYTPGGGIEQICAQSSAPAIVFGPERTGIHNDDLSLCQGVITVPTNPDFASLNLAQSVALMVYEFRRQNDKTLPVRKPEISPQRDVQDFMARLFEELEQGGFFKTPETMDSLKRSLNNIFVRQNLTAQEIRTLHGVVSALIGKKKKP